MLPYKHNLQNYTYLTEMIFVLDSRTSEIYIPGFEHPSPHLYTGEIEWPGHVGGGSTYLPATWLLVLIDVLCWVNYSLLIFSTLFSFIKLIVGSKTFK